MKRSVPFYVVSNIIKANHAFRFQMECIWKFGSKNVPASFPSEIEGYDLLFLLIKSKEAARSWDSPLVLLHLKVINTADQLICDLAELLGTDIHLLEGIHYLFRLIVRLLCAVHIALGDL